MIPILTVVLFLSLAMGGAVLHRLGDRRGAARVAPFFAGAAAVASVALVVATSGQNSGAAVPTSLFGSILLSAASLSLLAMSIGAPRAELDGKRLASPFALVFTFAAACLVQRTLVLAIIVALSAIPLVRRGRAVILPVVGSIVMAAGLIWLSRSGSDAIPVAPDAPSGALALVWLGAWMRAGLVPFHGWLPVLFERGYPAKAALTFAASPSVVVLCRVCLGARWMSGSAGTLFTALAALSALYGAFLCLGQKELLRAIGFQSLASTGLVVTGLCSREAAGVAGAVVHFAAASLFLTGLSLVAWGVRARFGSAREGGLADHARHASAAFLLFGLAAAGFPGTLCFVSEDLLLHGVIEHAPVIGTLVVITTALSAIAMIRLYFRVFLGPARPSARRDLAPPPIPDLFPREKAAFGILLAALIGLGVAPSPAVSAAQVSTALFAKGPH